MYSTDVHWKRIGDCLDSLGSSLCYSVADKHFFIVSIQDYWLSLLHKMLFGTKVLEVKRGCQDSEMVRVYAHCTNTKHG